METHEKYLRSMNTSMVDANHHVGKGNEGKNMSMKFIDLIVYDHIK